VFVHILVGLRERSMRNRSADLHCEPARKRSPLRPPPAVAARLMTHLQLGKSA